ncbi:MAG: PQQ-binding-like beta-propeller repeat protein [Acidimicrobiales bacterium]|nr:PQQ-binding-like beta-propeller repeat protein [Acidimicrobiales bacterium]
MSGYDEANSRYNPDERIVNANSVASLKPVWHLEGLKGVSSTPSVVDGVVYFGDWTGAVRAVEAATGREIWSTGSGAPIMSSPTVDGDAVYASSNRLLRRLDKATSTTVWEATTSDHPIAISPASPVVADGLVIQAVASGELMFNATQYSFRGQITAFDAATGSEVWRIFLTNDDDTSGAGVGVWSTAAVDRERGVIYVGTGNTYEPPASRMADSIVAIRYRTGEIAWIRQFTYPDVFSMGNRAGLDADVGAAPNLWVADGRAMVGAGDKRGDYHALDRETGEVVWTASLTPGSVLGGVIGSSAFAEGTIFVASNVGNPENNAPTSASKVVALDAVTGAKLWETELPGSVFAPVSAVRGVVFVATTGATFHAFDAATGDELWQAKAPDQIGGGASIVDGTVYWGYGYSLFGSGSGIGGLYAFRPAEGAEGSSGDSALAAGAGSEGESPGARLFRTSCASCHGRSGQGGTGPTLIGVADRLSRDDHLRVVRQGRNQMPPFEKVLEASEIDQIVDYERTELGR